ERHRVAAAGRQRARGGRAGRALRRDGADRSGAALGGCRGCQRLRARVDREAALLVPRPGDAVLCRDGDASDGGPPPPSAGLTGSRLVLALFAAQIVPASPPSVAAWPGVRNPSAASSSIAVW